MNFLTGEELSASEILELSAQAIAMKKERALGHIKPLLSGKTLGMVFEKPSVRTRFSFAVAMQELGGYVVESNTLTSKKEEPRDLARVLGGYCHALMVRTHAHSVLEEMAVASPVPLINGLSDSHHPCQVLADLMALQEKFGDLQGLTLAYVGDGNNMLHSLFLILPRLGVNVRYACPEGYAPDAWVIKKARELGARSEKNPGFGSIEAFRKPEEAVAGCDAVYTDVWASMGFEKEASFRNEAFQGFQVNEKLMALASPRAVVMHCLPMNRGQEVSDSLVDSKQSILFDQSENRLHVQKALLVKLLLGPQASGTVGEKHARGTLI